MNLENPGVLQSAACSSALQVQKLSDGDTEETTRSLYNRNVSSSKLLDDKTLEPLPEPKRMAGDIVSFKRRVLAAPPARIMSFFATKVFWAAAAGLVMPQNTTLQPRPPRATQPANPVHGDIRSTGGRSGCLPGMVSFNAWHDCDAWLQGRAERARWHAPGAGADV